MINNPEKTEPDSPTGPNNNQPKPVIELIIRLTLEDGNVAVSGAIHDKIFAYGLLEVAHEIIQKHHDEILAKAKQSAIIQANGKHRIMDFMRGK